MPAGVVLTNNGMLGIDGTLTVQGQLVNNSMVQTWREESVLSVNALVNNGTIFLNDGTSTIGSYSGEGKINYWNAAVMSDEVLEVVDKANIKRCHLVGDETALIRAVAEEGGVDYDGFTVYTNADITLTQNLEIPGHVEVVVGYTANGGAIPEFTMTIGSGVVLTNNGIFRNNNFTALVIAENAELVNNVAMGRGVQNMGLFTNYGTISNNGFFLNNWMTMPNGNEIGGTLTNYGVINNSEGNILTNEGILINHGTIEGEVENNGTYENNAGGGESEGITLEQLRQALSEGDYVLDADFQINESELLEIPAGATLTVTDGAVLTNNGTIMIKGTLSVENDASLNNMATITISDGGALVSSGAGYNTYINNNGTITNNSGNGQDTGGGIHIGAETTFYVDPEATLTSTGDVVVDGYLSANGIVNMQKGSVLFNNHQIDNYYNGTFTVSGTYRTPQWPVMFRNFFAELDGTDYIGEVNGLDKGTMSLCADSSMASMWGLVEHAEGYREIRYDVHPDSEATLTANGDQTTLTIPQNMMVHVRGNLTIAPGVTLINNGHIPVYGGGMLLIEGGFKGNDPVYNGGTVLNTAPHLTFAWVSDNEEGWYADEYQENEYLQMAPGDSRHIVFYYNTWNSAESDWNRQKLYPVHLEFSDNLTAMTFAQKAQEDEYYKRIKTGEDSSYFLYLEAKDDTWDQIGTVTYQGVSFEVAIERSETGFYAAPVASNENWLSGVEVDPMKGSCEFYFIMDSEYWRLAGTVASGDIWVERGGDHITVSDFGNGMVKCVVDPEYVANKWNESDFDFNLGFKVRNRDNYEEIQEWDCGVWIGTKWLGEADAHFVINEKTYEYYDDSQAYIYWEPVGEPNEYGEYDEYEPHITTLPKGVSYDSDSNTLTLNNANLESMEFVYEAWFDEEQNVLHTFLPSENLTIRLVGKNTITSDYVQPLHFAWGLNATIIGDGSLHIKAITEEGTRYKEDPTYLWFAEAIWLHNDSSLTIAGNAKVTAELVGINHFDDGTQSNMWIIGGEDVSLTLKDNATLTTVLPKGARATGDKRIVDENGAVQYPGGYRAFMNVSNILVQDNATLNTSEIYVDEGYSFTQTGGTVNINAIGSNEDAERWEEDVLVESIPFGHYHYGGLVNAGGVITVSGGDLNINVLPSDAEHSSSSWFNAIQLDGGELNLTGGNVIIKGRHNGNAIALRGQANLNYSGSILNVSTNTAETFTAIDVYPDSAASFNNGIINANNAKFMFGGEIEWNGTQLEGNGVSFNADGLFNLNTGSFTLNDLSEFIIRGQATINGCDIRLNNSFLRTEEGSGVHFYDGSITINQTDAELPFDSGMNVNGYFAMGGDDNEGWPQLNIYTKDLAAIINNGFFHQMHGKVDLKSESFIGFLNFNDVTLSGGEMNVQGRSGFIAGYSPKQTQGVLVNDQFVLNASGNNIGFGIQGPVYWNGGQVNAHAEGDANELMPAPFAVRVENYSPEEAGHENVSFLEINGGDHKLTCVDTGNGSAMSKGLALMDAPLKFNGGSIEINAEMAVYSVSHSEFNNIFSPALSIFDQDSEQYADLVSRRFTETPDDQDDWFHSVYNENGDYAGNVLITVAQTMSQDEFVNAMNALGEDEMLWLQKSVTITSDLELTRSVGVPRGVQLTVTNNATLTIPVETALQASDKGRILVEDGAKILNRGNLINEDAMIRIAESGYIPENVGDQIATIRDHFHFNEETMELYASHTQGVDNEHIVMVGHITSEEQIHAAIAAFEGKGYKAVEINPVRVTLTRDVTIPENFRVQIGGEYHHDEHGNVTSISKNFLTVGSNATVTVNGELNADYAASDINVGGKLIVNGIVFVCDGSTMSVTGTLVNNGGVHIGHWQNADHEYAGRLEIRGTMENYGYLNNQGPVNVYGKLINATRYVDDAEPYQGFMEISDTVNVYGTLENSNWITIGHTLPEGQEPQDVQTAYLKVHEGGVLWNNKKSEEDSEKDPGNVLGSIEVMDVAELIVDGELYNNSLIHGRPNTYTGICINGRLINNYHIEIGGFGRIVTSNNGVLENNYQVWTLTADATIDLTEGRYIRGSFEVDGENIPAILMAMYEIRNDEIGDYDAVAAIRGVDHSIVLINCDAYDYDSAKRFVNYAWDMEYEGYQLWINADMTIPEDDELIINKNDDIIIVKTEDKDATLTVNGTLRINRGLLDVWGCLEVGETGAVINIGRIDAIEGSEIVNHGYIEHVEIAEMSVGGEYRNEGDGVLQLNMMDGRIGRVDGNVDNSQMTVSFPIHNNNSPMGNAEQQLRDFVDTVQEKGYREGIVWLHTDLEVTEELFIPHNVTVFVGMESEDGTVTADLAIAQNARLIVSGNMELQNGSSLTVNGLYVQDNNRLIAHSGATVTVNTEFVGGDGAAMTIEDGATLYNNGYLSCGIMPLTVMGEYEPSAESVLEVAYINNGGMYIEGTVEGVENSAVTLYHPIREAFPEHNENTVAELINLVTENGYKYGLVDVAGHELTLTKDLTVPANVEIRVRGSHYIDENNQEVTDQAVLNINSGATLYNQGKLTIQAYATLNVQGRIEGNIPVSDGAETGPVTDFSQLKNQIAFGIKLIEVGAHVVVTDETFTIPDDVVIRVIQGGKLEIASGVTVNLNGQIWTSRDGGELIVRPEAKISGGTVMVRTGSLTNQGTIESELINVSFIKNQTELLNAVNGGVDVVHVTGNFSLTKGMTVSAGKVLIIDEGYTLTVNTTGTIANNGTIQVLGTLKYTRGKLTGNRIAVDGNGSVIGLPEDAFFNNGTQITRFSVTADTLQAPVGSEVEVYVKDFAPVNAEDFTIVPVNTEDPHVKQTEDGRWVMTSNAIEEVTVSFKAVDGNGDDIQVATSDITVEFYQQHIEIFYGSYIPEIAGDNFYYELASGQTMPMLATIMDGPYGTEGETEINRTGTTIQWEITKGADFVNLLKTASGITLTGKNVSEKQFVEITARAADGSAAERTIQVAIVPAVQKVDIQVSGESVSGKTIKFDISNDPIQRFDVVNSPVDAGDYARWQISDINAAHFVDDDNKPIYFTNEFGESTGEYATYVWGTYVNVEYTAVKTIKLTATSTDSSNKSATVTVLATQMPTKLVADESAVTSLIGGQSVTYKVRGQYLNLETREEELRGILTTGITWTLADKDGNPIDAHPYATLSTVGKLSTKAVADKETVYLLAKFDGAAEESNLLMAVDLYPAITKVDVVENSSVITDATVMRDLADTTPVVNAELNVYPYDGAVKSVEWKTSNARIAVVTPDVETALNAAITPGDTVGTATITANIVAWNGAKKTVTFKVKFDTLTVDITTAIGATNSDEVSIDEKNQVVGLRSGKYVTLTGTPWAKNNSALTTGVTWALENAADKTYLSVTAAGKLTANTVNHPTYVNVVVSSKDGAYKETVTVEILPKLETALYLWTADGTERNYVTKATLLSEADSNGGKTIELHANVEAGETLKWTSSKTSVATVDEDTGVVTVLAAGTATITAKATDNETGVTRSATVNVKGSKISSYTEITDKSGNSEDLIVASGKTIDLVGTVTFSDGTTNKSVNWSVVSATVGETVVDPAAYAKIATSGRLTATANLTETVTVEVNAVASDGMSEPAKIYVTIQPLANAVTISGPFGENKSVADVTNLTREWNMGADDMDNVSSYANTMISLSADVLSIASEKTASQKVKWTSSSAAVATVDADTGEVTCLKAGTTTITATAQDGSGKKATFKLTVIKKMLDITLDAGTAKVASGKKLTVKADIFPSDTTNKKLTWSLVGVDNNLYATITTAGVLTAKTVTAPTVVTVQAVAVDGSGVVATIPVTIYPVTTAVQIHQEIAVDENDDPVYENVTGKTVYVSADGNLSLKAIAAPELAMNAYSWTTSNASYATVNADGIVHGVAPGKTATITATAQDGSGKKATVKVTVINPVADIQLADGQIIAGGKSLKMANYVTFEPANPTVKTLKWEIIEGAEYATINASTGELKAKNVAVEQIVKVQATTTDGTQKAATTYVTVYPLTTKLDIQQVAEDYTRTTVTGKTLTVYVTTNANEDGTTTVTGAVQLAVATTPAPALQNWKWSSSNNSVAEVDGNGLVIAKQAGKTVTITATAQDGSGKKATVNIKTVQLMQDLTFSADFYDLAEGKSLTLKPTVYPSYTANKALTWEIVDGAEYATVSTSGVVKAKSLANVEEGVIPTVTIRATAKDGGGATSDCVVRIYPLTKSMAITGAGDGKLYVNTEEDATITGTMQLGVTTTPAAASQNWTWSSSNNAYATVDTNGLVTAKQPGKTVTITAKATDGSGKSASVKIQTIQLMEDLDITASADILGSGKSLTLKTVVAPATTTNKAVTWKVLPNEDGNTYASISTSGTMTAKKVTEQTDVTVLATAKDGSNKEATFVVTLYPITTKLQIQNAADENVTGKTLELKMTGNTETGFISESLNLYGLTTPENAYQGWTWTSSNKNQVEVDPTTGVVTGVVPGKTVTITAKAMDGSGKSATVKVKTIQLMEDLEITAGAAVLGGGKNLTLKTVVAPATTTNKAVTWKVLPSDDGNTYATISTSGVLTAKKVTEPVEVTVLATAKDGSNKEATYVVTLYPITTKLQIQNAAGENVTGKTLELKMTGNSEDGFTSENLNLYGLTTPDNACGEWTWTSSNKNQVEVDQTTGVVTGVVPGKTVTITAKAIDGSGKSATVKVKTVQLMTDLTITNVDPVLASGKSLTMKTAVEPATTTNKTVTWEVLPNDDGNIYATISSAGVLKAKTVTEETVVKVRATAKDGSEVFAESAVYLYPATSKLQLETVTDDVPVNVSGKTVTLYVRRGTNQESDQFNDVMKLKVVSTPANAYQYWTFTSSAPDYAKVDANTGTIEAIKGGKTVTITAKALDGTGKTMTVKIKTVQLMTEMTITNEYPVLASGKSLTLKTVVSPTNTANKKVTWTVLPDENGEVYATITSAGVLKAKTVPSVKTVKVAATAQDGSGTVATTNVTIYPAVTTKVAIIPAQGDAATVQKVEVDEIISLNAVSFPETTAAQAWTWSSSNSKVATVDSNGEVTGIKTGTVTITCKAVDGSGKSATIKVQVVAPAND